MKNNLYWWPTLRISEYPDEEFLSSHAGRFLTSANNILVFTLSFGEIKARKFQKSNQFPLCLPFFQIFLRPVLLFGAHFYGFILCVCLSTQVAYCSLFLLQNDDRSYISVSTFGFFKGGGLDVKLRQFHPEPLNSNDIVSDY